jgi:hypothetical protein
MKLKLLVVSFLISLGQVALSQGTGPVQTLVPDRNYEKEVLALINHAEASIDLIQSQFFAEREAPEKILQALIDRKTGNPNFKIRVLLEFAVNLRNFRTQEKLAAAGIEVFKSFSGSVRGSAVCVDGKRLLLGSTKMTKSSIGKNNEMNALIESETIGKAFTGYFDVVSKDPSVPVSLRVTDGNTTFITDATYIDEVLSLIKSATDSLDISMYLFRLSKDTDGRVKEIFDALVEAQAKPNFKIRILLEGGKDSQKIAEANRETQTLLKANGIKAVYVEGAGILSRSRYIIKDQKEILLGSDSWYGEDLKTRNLNLKIENPDLAKRLSIYFSQKVAYEGQRDPVPAPRRFWIGFRRPDITPEAFLKGINEQLIPGTKVGAERGLVGYTPTMLQGISTLPDMPDEIAMVTYLDDESYRAIRDAPDGAAYGELHGDFFALKPLPSGLKSGSAVAVPYQGQVAFGSAYYMSKGLQNFQNLEWSYSVLARKAGETDTDFLNRVKTYTEKFYSEFTSIGLVDYTFRIEKNYIFEYHVWKSKEYYSRAQMFISLLRGSNFEHLHTELLAKGEFGQTHIESGQGVNIQFKTEIENPEKVYSPLREKFLSPITKEPVQAKVIILKKEDRDFAKFLADCRSHFQKLMRGMR